MQTRPQHLIDLGISEEQEANLRKLSAYLKTLPPEYPDFEMSLFVNDEDRGSALSLAFEPECGTAACAAGHGPAAGIAPIRGETWADYSERAFTDDGAAWHWMFNADWARVDNTAHGAAARIDWLLERGVPEDALAQMIGDEPLSYALARDDRA